MLLMGSYRDIRLCNMGCSYGYDGLSDVGVSYIYSRDVGHGWCHWYGYMENGSG